MATKKFGRHSQQSNDFLQPQAVTITSATDVGTSRTYLATANTTSAASASGTGGAVTLAWTLPADSPAATSYSITTTPSTYTATTSSSPYTFQGLASAVSYTFTITASNAVGNSTPTTSSSVTATTVPSAPTSVSAASTVLNTDRVTWSAPTSTGGKAISSYTVVSSDGPSYTNATSPKDIAETGGTSQTYTIYALNANGTSAGATTNSVTTFTPPYFPPFFPPHFPPFFPPSFSPPGKCDSYHYYSLGNCFPLNGCAAYGAGYTPC